MCSNPHRSRATRANPNRSVSIYLNLDGTEPKFETAVEPEPNLNRKKLNGLTPCLVPYAINLGYTTDFLLHRLET